MPSNAYIKNPEYVEIWKKMRQNRFHHFTNLKLKAKNFMAIFLFKILKVQGSLKQINVNKLRQFQSIAKDSDRKRRGKEIYICK